MAFSKLLGLDTNDVSPERARKAFLAEVRRLMTDQGLVHDAAWAQVKQLEPELFQRSIEKPTTDISLANDVPPIPLASKAFLLPAFYMPQITSDEIFSVAYAANGYQSMRVDPKKVFMGLVTYTMKKQNANAAAARRQIQDDYPKLAEAAGQSLGQG